MLDDPCMSLLNKSFSIDNRVWLHFVKSIQWCNDLTKKIFEQNNSAPQVIIKISVFECIKIAIVLEIRNVSLSIFSVAN